MRENGFYWVRYGRDLWTIAEWRGYWRILESELIPDDESFSEIGEMIPPHKESECPKA